MKKILVFLVLTTIFCGCESNEDVYLFDEKLTESKSSSFYLDLAYQHAPVHYQDVDRTGSHGLSGKADYITRYDFDGDLNAKNNWDNIANSSRKGNAVGYYSVVETSTHYFITYAFFHPRDWTDIWFLYRLDEHENDLEGVLTIVKKDNSTYGKAIGIVTVFHSDFYSYKASNSGLTNGNEDIDGTLTTQNHNGVNRFKTSAEAKGHGIKAHAKQQPGGSDYVVYFPSKTTSEYPSDIYDRNVKYKLVNIFENGGMWDQRFNTDLFSNAKSFQKSYGNGSANAPWNWDDKNDGGNQGLLAGGIAYYPAHLVDEYFDGLGGFSKTYIYNPYLGIE
ncbi:hypothetical protein D1818_15800 [Aquimarina sp. BL5]|uniref:hypothetical protein n=1 Tax=Aquimarina sp. BL5 TaxID=1714860 RepID=UPI000E486149|nr:hypothetical protein [Aquimarina sp. BL5]AXT52230.1 hypothetical protein D1818_15800 [Aquimarina sp. BL5]RKN05638.1 hypothetical protein D7036_10225 [Aquimarina sp. BL5]